MKLLNDKLSELHTLCANTQLEAQFPRTLFKVRKPQGLNVSFLNWPLADPWDPWE